MAEDVRLRAGDGFFVGDADDAERLADTALQQRPPRTPRRVRR